MEKWCCRGGLNSRPLPYQGSALPLSYCSACGGLLQARCMKARDFAENFGASARRAERPSTEPGPGHVRCGAGGPGCAECRGRRVRCATRWTIAPPRFITLFMSTARNDPAREARLKAALKANIARRKQQARARADDGDTASGDASASEKAGGRAQTGPAGHDAADDPATGNGAGDTTGRTSGPDGPASRKDRT